MLMRYLSEELLDVVSVGVGDSHLIKSRLGFVHLRKLSPGVGARTVDLTISKHCRICVPTSSR